MTTYNEEQVFIELKKFLNNSQEDIDRAYKIHRKLASLISEDLREEAYYRYLELGGTIGLNMKNYKIYEYSHEGKEAYRLIYPNEDLDNLEETEIEARVDFKFVSAPCVLLEITVEQLEKFKDQNWNSFVKAVDLAINGRDNPVGNIRNIDIEW